MNENNFFRMYEKSRVYRVKQTRMKYFVKQVDRANEARDLSFANAETAS